KKQLESLLNTVEELRSENIILRKKLAQAEERADARSSFLAGILSRSTAYLIIRERMY
ncbi:hypothetical protein J6590_081089, partial [Homalodisca vitripennis]